LVARLVSQLLYGYKRKDLEEFLESFQNVGPWCNL